MTKHTPTREIEEAALQTAQLDYDEMIRDNVRGVSNDELSLDHQRFGLMAHKLAELVRDSWRDYRKTHDYAPSKRDFTTAEAAAEIAVHLAAAFDFSPEATRVLEAAVRVECSQ